MSEYIKSEYRDLAKSDSLQNKRSSMLQIGYTEKQLEMLPPTAIIGISCGNPLEFCNLKPGKKLLDLGCGVGTDVILAGLEVMPFGKVIGLDFLPEMIDRAQSCAADCKQLKEGVAEFLNLDVSEGKYPFEDNYFDYVISNCCICLVDQERVFPEVFRILKPGGAFIFSEVASKEKRPLPQKLFRCIQEAIDRGIKPSNDGSLGSRIMRIYVTLVNNNAIEPIDTLQKLRNAGFENPNIIQERVQPLDDGSMPKMIHDTLPKVELEQYMTRLKGFLSQSNVNDFMSFVTVMALKS
ncbi:methyltransferase domain-containing protein [Moorena sp. SIO4G3]|uniref:methyltransferase domain-containing protein n=1 Tax=Moorena sp. SIO4G3 TaxID=2607821 RepID=UPI00142B5028|nr:methyltransferase domain-containing protein [Moorena sp. SIO4G3]NEO78805.1 methyltransferase domain-containing protein [Moorena sp. SIO4G3]